MVQGRRRATVRGVGASLVLASVLAVAAPGTAATTPEPVARGEVPAVLAPVDPGAGLAPDPTLLAALLAGPVDTRALGGNVGVSVLDVATGTPLFGAAPTQPVTPASTTKILTAAAVLAAAGPDAVLRTTVVRVPSAAGGTAGTAEPTTELTGESTASPEPAADPAAEPARIVLVGGGDPLLTSLPADNDELPAYPRRASLQDLAADAAQALAADGVERVRLGYDDTLFTGPAESPRWEESYAGGVVTRVSALSADQGQLDPRVGGSFRVPDPAAQSAERFAAQLERRGIRVVGEPAAALAPAGAELIAEVSSAPVAALAEYMLVASDNDVAEALARQVAVARGEPASFDGAAAAMLAELTGLGVDATGVMLFDGSGLSRSNRIPAQVLTRTLTVAASGPRTELRPLAAGLAIGGVNGTLALRYATAPTNVARGVVRAKSGFLTGVISLGGLIVDATGRLLAFDVVSDTVRPGAGVAARAALDQIVATLARCGCR